ncbi:XylR N-terminal domain-containing protein [Bacillus tuaregi]|uniref:XylR N-terminal domain-containing protein n=1 Tax=Bacillus tuaregi TaxID=1816695 RepID=UPI0008F92DCD|nr:XylR N-terminal domain-containing protein [Bacillus tuaregi]
MHTTIHFIDQNHSNRERSLHIQNRSIIVDTYAFGSFRKDLIRNIGLERTKGFLFRYGWNMGIRDAKECKEKEQYDTIQELIEYGPVMHSMKGYVESRTLKLEISNETNVKTLQMDSVWEHSFEADEHLRHIGASTSPVCYTLSGYASGFVSEIFGEMVIFKEICCRAAGASECIAIGKSCSLWGDEIQEELYYLEETPILKELELTYEKLLQERDQLTLVLTIHKQLTEEVVKGSSLETIIEAVFRLTKIPVIIHNVHGHPMTFAGFNKLSQKFTPNGLFQYINKNMSKNSVLQTFQPMNDQQEHFKMLTHPIYLQEKRMGYCSFMMKEQQYELQELAKLIIEKVTSICSLCFLFEKTKLASLEQMKSYLLKEILSAQYTLEDELVSKAGLFHFDLTRPFYLGIIGYAFNDQAFQNEQGFCREVMSSISHYCTKQGHDILLDQTNHSITLFVIDYFESKKASSSFFHELLEFLHSRFPGSHFYMGISKKTNTVQLAPAAYNEALGAYRLISKDDQIIFYDNLGMVGTLINENNTKNVKEMALALLGNIEMDCQKNVELIRTLYLFLINGGNLEKTADNLALSISGLRYRVGKIEELLQEDIRSPLVSCQLLIAIQALIILGELDIKMTSI